MDICDTAIAFTTKCDIPGRLRVKTMITHQVESPLSEKNIDPCDLINLMSIKLFQRLGKLFYLHPEYRFNVLRRHTSKTAIPEQL